MVQAHWTTTKGELKFKIGMNTDCEKDVHVSLFVKRTRQFQIWRCAHVFFLCLGYWKLFIKDWMKLMQRPFNHSEIIIQSPSQIWQCFEPEGSRDLRTSTNKEKKKEEDFWIGHTDMLEYIPQPLISFFKHTFMCIFPSCCYWFKGPWKMFSPHTMTPRLLKAAKSTIKGPLLYLTTKRDKSIRRGFPTALWPCSWMFFQGHNTSNTLY